MYIIIAHRTAASIFGSASKPCVDKNGILYFETEDEARAEARKYNARVGSANVFYTVREA